jgi:hypothetical protein
MTAEELNEELQHFDYPFTLNKEMPVGKEEIIKGLKDIRDSLYSEYPENYMTNWDKILTATIELVRKYGDKEVEDDSE